MDFARQQRDPKRHMIGISLVVLLHAFVIWALMTGLARKAIEVIKKPLTATIVEEIKAPPPPPPPPPKKIVEMPKVQAPIDTYVPPPDIPPPQSVTQDAPTITAVQPTAPTQPYVIAPPPPVHVEAPPAPPPPPKPAVRRGITPIEREDPVYPRAAIRAGIDKGRVLARVDIDEKGNVTNVNIISAEPPRHFDNAVRDALMKWKFKAEGEKYVGEIEVIFTLKD
jgi:periplasmic protein TonB